MEYVSPGDQVEIDLDITHNPSILLATLLDLVQFDDDQNPEYTTETCGLSTA